MSEQPSEQEVIAKFKGWMILGFWLLLLGLFAFLANNTLEKKYNPNQVVNSSIHNGLRQVRLQRNPYGHYVANGFINNYPVTFLIDTGASTIAMSETLAKKLKLKYHSSTYSQTANGVTQGWNTQLNQVRLGDIQINHLNAHVLPKMLKNEVLLGMNFLKQLDWQQKGDQLILEQPY